MKTEALLEDGRHAAMSDNLSEASSAERDHARIAAAAALAVSSATDDHNKPPTPSNRPDHFLSAFHGNGLHQREHEDRVEALQVCCVIIYLYILTKCPDRGILPDFYPNFPRFTHFFTLLISGSQHVKHEYGQRHGITSFAPSSWRTPLGRSSWGQWCSSPAHTPRPDQFGWCSHWSAHLYTKHRQHQQRLQR